LFYQYISVDKILVIIMYLLVWTTTQDAYVGVIKWWE